MRVIHVVQGPVFQTMCKAKGLWSGISLREQELKARATCKDCIAVMEG